MNTQIFEHRFVKICGKRAEHTYFAPNRVNLPKEYTDKNAGQAFPCPLRLDICLLIAKRGIQQCQVSNINTNRLFAVNANACEDKRMTWTQYPSGERKKERNT